MKITFKMGTDPTKLYNKQVYEVIKITMNYKNGNYGT
jgi:hypothetical protein